jgi:hypothetical protein
MNELLSKIKSAEVDRGMTANIEGPLEPATRDNLD